MKKIKLQNISRSRDVILKRMEESLKHGNRIHVISSGDKWGIKTEGKSKVYKYFDSQKDAIKHAINIAAKRKHAELVVHKKNGLIQD